jgi:DNA polymerase-3 subunit delta'
MFDDFYGNRAVTDALEQMIARARIPQTLLVAGKEGVGKATLARRFGARLLGSPEKIEQDDLSLARHAEYILEREKLPSEKRAEDPLLFSTHPDFLTFPPDGPLRQITIQQMRLLKERAQFKPLRGDRRVFLVDHIDRANEQAANSLLKILEEPPDHLILILTAENPYDLLPTIRSRSIALQLAPLTAQELRQFITSRGLDRVERRIALAQGSPGVAASIDLEAYDRRRAAMVVLLQAAAGAAPFAQWVRFSERISSSKTEKLDFYLNVLYLLLEDMLVIRQDAGEMRNPDIRPELETLARKVSFEWLRTAVKKVDELMDLLRRNIQKGIALDALVVGLREIAA